MKLIRSLLLTLVVAMLTTTGCLAADATYDQVFPDTGYYMIGPKGDVLKLGKDFTWKSSTAGMTKEILKTIEDARLRPQTVIAFDRICGEGGPAVYDVRSSAVILKHLTVLHDNKSKGAEVLNQHIERRMSKEKLVYRSLFK